MIQITSTNPKWVQNKSLKNKPFHVQFDVTDVHQHMLYITWERAFAWQSYGLTKNKISSIYYMQKESWGGKCAIGVLRHVA
jgi:hypothetical protein